MSYHWTLVCLHVCVCANSASTDHTTNDIQLSVVTFAPLRQWWCLSWAGKCHFSELQNMYVERLHYSAVVAYAWQARHSVDMCVMWMILRVKQQQKAPGRALLSEGHSHHSPCPLCSTASLGNVFIQKKAIQYLKQAHWIWSKTIFKVVWEIQCHWLALKMIHVCWNPCVWLWKR